MQPKHPTRPTPVAARLLLLPLLGLLILIISACASHQTPAPQMAASQPETKNLSVLQEGTLRNLVVAELGQPIWSGGDSQGRVDVYEFKQGYTRAFKTTRVVFHGLADLLTLGLWEVVGQPIERIYSGKTTRVEVAYDVQERVKSARILQPENAIPAGTSAPTARETKRREEP